MFWVQGYTQTGIQKVLKIVGSLTLRAFQHSTVQVLVSCNLTDRQCGSEASKNDLKEIFHQTLFHSCGVQMKTT